MQINIPFTKMGHLRAGSGRTTVHLFYFYCRVIGGLLVAVTGGRPHVGALTTGIRLKGKRFSRTFSLPGHRDNVITKRLHFILARKIKGPFLICAGIHYDKATKGQIQNLIKNSERLGRQLAGILS